VNRNRVAALIFAGVFVLLAAVTSLLGLEAYLLWTGQAPITWYSECLISAYPLATFFVASVVAAGLGALFAHFFWSKTLRR
jgi:hypothetical protein